MVEFGALEYVVRKASIVAVVEPGGNVATTSS
jgi:hypothetical protein